MNWTDVRDKLRIWREENVRQSSDVIAMWDSVFQDKIHKLGDEQYVAYEQVFVAALDCNRIDVANECLHALTAAFPDSLRIYKLQVMKLEAQERYEEALELLQNIIKKDKTNAAPRKRRVAILKACGKIPEAIKELTEYLKKFMVDQEAWQELCDLYLSEQEYGRAAFCMEELILHNPHSHLLHQRLAEIKYTQGGFENMEIARSHYCMAIKLNPNNMRALYGLFLTSTNIAMSPKTTSVKKKEANKLAAFAMKQITERYQEKCSEDDQVAALEGLVTSLQITSAS
ncbi:ER membrane protein complex subunit 2-like [Macrosteles quadrilineatus]|uniref:ER membrane protein complex subunit 2-like n=1 Tax=Macrosteles quadrilineatus TaxID=74068 RepID=UPI0023E2B4CB|nr:ER membrane protein complex subunit 2-like [Macrosteles quadrilineatus]